MDETKFPTCPYVSDCTASVRHELGCHEPDYISKCPARLERRSSELEEEVARLRELHETL
jgi:hypothetical protein